MDISNKARKIELLNFTKPPMRAFHMTWFAFFLCFFAWFGVAPLMKVIRAELQLTQAQVGYCMIASVSITILARLLIGWLCDRYGPRLTYSWLLVICSLPVMGIGFAYNFESFLICRLLIGAIGASFVITQYHTSVMFAPNCVGTANATSAGWGNLGGGVTQFAMPALMALFVGFLGFSDAMGWRAAMFCAGLVCMFAGVAYYFVTQDTPEGNFAELRASGKLPSVKMTKGAFMEAVRDYRVWALFCVYGACFGVELTINNMAALYFTDKFGLSMFYAGLTASAFGLMNLFARTLGGYFGDVFGLRWGLKGRVGLMFIVLFCEGLALMFFSQMSVLAFAIPSLIVFSLFVQMSEGATYSVVPFINKRALGAVAGIVGAGGNVGAVSAGFLFTGYFETSTALLILGACVTCLSLASLAVRFSPEAETAARKETIGVESTVMEPALSTT